MTKTSDPFRDLPMRALAFCQRPTGPDKDKAIQVAVVAESLMPGAKLTAARANLYDFQGTLKAKFDVLPTALGSPVLPAVFLAQPGSYRVRFMATDGKVSGAVDVPVEVGLTQAGPFKLSGLWITTTDGKPKMEFQSEPAATAFFEMYGTWPAAPAEVEVAVNLLGLPGGPKELERAAKQTELDKFVVSVPIPLADSSPGRLRDRSEDRAGRRRKRDRAHDGSQAPEVATSR